MRKILEDIKNFLLDILFPKFCIRCNKEGNYLCPDCLASIKISNEQFCPFCSPPVIVLDGKTCRACSRSKKLAGLFCAGSYKNPLVKKMLGLFKYEPFVKDLSLLLASLIITHFKLLNKEPNIDFVIPVPSHPSKLKERGFNPAREIAFELAKFLKKPLLSDVLVKTKPTLAQVELKYSQERLKNVRGAFSVPNRAEIQRKKILLVDDIFTTGATMEECAQTLKAAGAREVWGAVVARG